MAEAARLVKNTIDRFISVVASNFLCVDFRKKKSDFWKKNIEIKYCKVIFKYFLFDKDVET